MTQIQLLSAPEVGSEDRNVYVDWARALSVCVVVVFHTRLYTVARTAGELQVAMWDPPHFLWIVSWPLMAIPMFFIAGGYGHSVNMVKASRLGTGYGYFLANRARKMLGPTTVFIGICAIAASVVAIVTNDVAEIADLSRAGMNLLWFITVYLAVTMVAPVMVSLHDRFGVLVLAVLAAGAAGIDALSAGMGSLDLRNLNMIPVWLFAHQLGIAYHRGWFRSWSWLRLATTAAVSCLGIAFLVFVLGYPAVSVGVGSQPIANVQPPTFAMVFLGCAQVCALAAFEKAAPRWATASKAHAPVSTINALLMTIYLWHVPCIIAVNGLMWLTGLVSVVPAFVLHLVVMLVSLGVIALLVPLIARLDLALIPPLGERQSASLAVAATIVATAGVAVVWQTGLVVHPSEPWSTAGVIAVAAGWLLMRRAARSR